MLTCAEIAKKVRTDLKTNYPAVKFHVRTRNAVINVCWIDGPPERTVDMLLSAHPCQFGVDHIFCERSYSPDFMRQVIEEVCAEYDLPELDIKINANGSAYLVSDQRFYAFVDDSSLGGIVYRRAFQKDASQKEFIYATV